MPIFSKKMAPKSEKESSGPADLAVALQASRQAKKTMTPAAPADHEQHYASIADAILQKKQDAKMMAEGGMVEDDDMADDDMDSEDMAKENYEDQDIKAVDAADEGGDMISSIRSRMKSKRS
jgi:hypothetical protein